MTNTQDIKTLMAQANELKAKQKAINKEMKLKKMTIAKEYTDGLSPEVKAKQIADAEDILKNVAIKKLALKTEFKSAMLELKTKVTLAKDILAFVNYKSEHSLPKVKNAYIVNNNGTATFKRDGIKDISFKIVNGWEKILKAELKKQGINGNDRVADNVIYKMQQAVLTHNAQ